MRKLSIALFSMAFVGLIAGSASAQCNFDVAAKGKGGKFSLIRSFAGCPSVTFAAPNTATQTSTPACTPPFAHSTFNFGVKGKCDVKFSHKKEDPCKDGSGIPCSNIGIKTKCGDVTESDGVTPVTNQGWALQTVARATFDDNLSGDMTVIDFPAQFSMDTNAGKLSMKSDTNALLLGLFGPGNSLPGCTTLALLSVAVADENGDIFATLGSSSP